MFLIACVILQVGLSLSENVNFCLPSMKRKAPLELVEARLLREPNTGKTHMSKQAKMMPVNDTEKSYLLTEIPEKKVSFEEDFLVAKKVFPVMEKIKKVRDAPLNRMERLKARKEMRRKNAGRLMKEVELVLANSVLEEMSVSPATIRDYAMRLDEFYNYVETKNLDVGTDEHLEDSLVQFMEHLFHGGEPANEGEKLKSAFEFANPTYQKMGPKKLPRVIRALKGWRKHAPSQKTFAMPEEIAALVAKRLWEKNKKEMALWVLLNFSTYLRPGENCRLRCKDVIAPVRGSEGPMTRWTLMISPFEGLIPTKTNTFDEAISLDDDRLPFLGPALGRLAERKIKKAMTQRKTKADAEEMPLWSFKAEEVLKEFQKVGKETGLDWLCETTYVLRHGGASRDVALKIRSLVEVQRRGRWASAQGLKHYEKHGRLQWICHKAGEANVEEGRSWLKSCSTLFRDC